MLPLVFVVLVAASIIGIRLTRRAVLLRRQRQSELPVSYHPLSKRTQPRWGWTVGRSSATIWTKALNHWPDWAVHCLGTRSRGVIIAIYDLGAVLACAVSLLSILGLFLATSDVWYSIIICKMLQARSEDMVGINTAATTRPFLEPIIPGITRPFSHLPILVIALLVNQGIHEAGHALSGAFDGVSSSTVSIGFVGFIMPMASVSFDLDDLDDLDRASSMRLAAAGPLHNLGTWIVLLLLGSLGVSSLYLENVSARGLYVQRMRQGSELSTYLPDFAVITHIDLVPLAGSASSTNWVLYLGKPEALTHLAWENLNDANIKGVVSWEGSRSILLEDIEVSEMAPRNPRRVMTAVRLYIQYFVGMTLSLAILNLLPFPHSDGSKLLTAAVSRQHEDLESGKIRMHLGSRAVWIKTLEWTVIGTGACYGIGQGILHFVA